jgi:tetratricopeptide (TPR) repeat protein
VSKRWGLGIAICVLGIVAAGGTSTASAQSGACTGGGKISKQIAKPMAAAKDAIKVKKWNEVLARTREAAGTQGFTRTAFDQYWIHEFNGYAYYGLNQYGEAAREYEAALNSPCMPENGKPERFKALANLNYSLRNYPKVVDYANRALKVQRDPDLMVTLGQAYYQMKDDKNAMRVMNDVIASFEQQGRVPKEQQILLVLTSCQRVNDNGCVTRLFEKLVLHYPKPEYWQNLLSSLMSSSELNDNQKINVMRLALNVDVMKKPDQYKEMAQIALDKGLPGEAQAVLDQAFTKKLFKEQRDVDLNSRLLAKAKGAAESDKTALTQKDAAARSTPTGDDDVQVGAGYLSYGETEKAIEALKRGIGQGGLKDADEASIVLGIAYLKANNKAEAAKAFRGVKNDPTMARIAKLWLLNT